MNEVQGDNFEEFIDNFTAEVHVWIPWGLKTIGTSPQTLGRLVEGWREKEGFRLFSSSVLLQSFATWFHFILRVLRTSQM